jgi:hypothetical protein
MIREIIESIKKSKKVKEGDFVLISGKWYHVEEVDGDTIWVTDNDGKEYEFKIKEIEAVEESLTEENWVNKVKPKWTPPEGTFAKDTPAEKTAEIVCKASEDLKQAVERVNFFFNRCGEKCSGWGEQKRKQIIDILHKICKES